jgi:hypothetical protein
VAALGIHDPLVRERVDAAVGKRGAHHGEVGCGDGQAALARIQLDRLCASFAVPSASVARFLLGHTVASQ